MKGSELLLITELFLPTKGGTAVWFDEVYRRLGNKNIHILTASVPGSEEHDREHPNNVIRVDLQRVRWLKPESLLMYIRLLLHAFKICFSHKIQVIHAGRVLPEGLVAIIAGKIFSIKTVIYAHGEEITTWRQAAKFKAMSFAYRKADKVIANSEFTRDELLKLGVMAERICLVHPGVDIDTFRSGLETIKQRELIKLQAEQNLILSVGRLSRRKGFDQVIKSLPSLIDKGFDVHYAIVGLGEDLSYLKSLAESCGVTDRVHLLGHVEAADLPHWYNACDIFAMPNREINGDTEGFGLVFLEAAACGKTVLAGLSGGTGSAVIDGVSGLRIDGSVLASVESGLAKLLGDESVRTKLEQQGMLRARSEFSWAAVASRTEQEVGQ